MRKAVFIYVKKGNIYLKVYTSETWSKTLNLILLHLIEYQNTHTKIFNLRSFPGHSVSSTSRLWTPQFSSVAQSCLTLCDPMDCSTPGLPVYHQLLESTQLVHWVGDAIQPSHPLSSSPPPPPMPSIFSSIRVFSNESVLPIRWPKYWSFSFNISPSNEYSGLISFRMDWLDFLAVQGTLKSLLQHYSSKASILRHSAFFIVQLSHPHDYWKNHSTD